MHLNENIFLFMVNPILLKYLICTSSKASIKLDFQKWFYITEQLYFQKYLIDNFELFTKLFTNSVPYLITKADSVTNKYCGTLYQVKILVTK